MGSWRGYGDEKGTGYGSNNKNRPFSLPLPDKKNGLKTALLGAHFKIGYVMFFERDRCPWCRNGQFLASQTDHARIRSPTLDCIRIALIVTACQSGDFGLKRIFNRDEPKRDQLLDQFYPAICFVRCFFLAVSLFFSCGLMD